MHKTVTGLTALVALSVAGTAFGQAIPDDFQQNEAPGTEIEIDLGKDGADIHRKDGKPLFGGITLGGEADDLEPQLAPLDDPDSPVDSDPIDDELPGEGPESLSGPDDEDPLPY